MTPSGSVPARETGAAAAAERLGPSRVRADDERRRGEELLLRALCRASDVDAAEVERALERGVDWPRFAELVRHNRVIPFAWRRLGEGWLDAMPHEARATMEATNRDLSFHLLVLTRELVSLLEACAAERIEAVPYKGPVLAALFYADHAARQYRDIDLLVHPRDLARARALLEARGWRAREELDEAEDRSWIERDCELHYDLDDERMLELHWHVLPRVHARGWSPDTLWQELVPAELAGVAIRTFAPEEWLVLLCIHGGDKHRWSRLQMVLDVARLLATRPELDWERVLARARAVDRERTLLLGVLLAWDLLDAPVPGAVLARAAARADLVARAAFLRDRAFTDGQHMPAFPAWSGAVRALEEHLKGAGVTPPRASSLGRYALTALEPDWGDRQALALPRALDFLHWGLRPVRILARHGVGVLRRTFGA